MSFSHSNYQPQKRINYLFIFFLFLAGLLIFRFADLQILSGQGYQGESASLENQSEWKR